MLQHKMFSVIYMGQKGGWNVLEILEYMNIQNMVQISMPRRKWPKMKDLINI